MSTVVVCLERHYVDAGYSHTVIWIYIFVVSGSQSVTTSLIIIIGSFCFVFLPELPLLLSICSFSCLSRAYRCPKIKTVTMAEGILICWVCTLGLGWGLPISWLCTFDFQWLTFGPQQVFTGFPTPLPPPRRCFSDCNPLVLPLLFIHRSACSHLRSCRPKPTFC